MTDNLEAIGVGRLSRSLTVAMIGVASRAFNGHQLAWLLFPMAAIVFVGPARADLVTQYSFTDVVAGTLNRNATTVAANVTAGNITDAPTVNSNPTSRARQNYRCRLRHATGSLRRPCELQRKFGQSQRVLHVYGLGQRWKRT